MALLEMSLVSSEGPRVHPKPELLSMTALSSFCGLELT